MIVLLLCQCSFHPVQCFLYCARDETKKTFYDFTFTVFAFFFLLFFSNTAFPLPRRSPLYCQILHIHDTEVNSDFHIFSAHIECRAKIRGSLLHWENEPIISRDVQPTFETSLYAVINSTGLQRCSKKSSASNKATLVLVYWPTV